MNSPFDILRFSFFRDQFQEITLDEEGKVQSHAGHLLTLPSSYSGQVFEDFGFPAELVATLRRLTVQSPPVWRMSVEATLWGRVGIYDFGFQRLPEGWQWLVIAREIKPAGMREVWQSEDPEPAPLVTQARVRVLVAEDNPFNQKVTQRQLERLGFDCTLANHGKKALELLEQAPFDIVLMDLNMPEMNGYEACEWIRNKFPEPLRHIPVIALSGSGLTATDPGFDTVLKKPVQESLLAQTIRQYVRPGIEESNPDAPAYIRLDYLHEVTQSSAVLMVELIDIFLEEVPVAIETMDKQIQAKEWRSLRELAHKTKANFRYVGADQMFSLTDTIERYTAGGSLVDQIPNLASQLEKLLSPTCAALREARKNLITGKA